MITASAQYGIDEIFNKAIKATFIKNSEDYCEIETTEIATDEKDGDFAIMTISSSSFKLLTMFHLATDDSLANHFLDLENSKTTKDEFQDVFLEFVNLCCGSMNRDLLTYFPSLGMSTPYILKNDGLEFIPLLKPGYRRQFQITGLNNAKMKATICVCDYSDIDFEIKEDLDQSSIGEMELF